jgi:hypothetical protein
VSYDLSSIGFGTGNWLELLVEINRQSGFLFATLLMFGIWIFIYTMFRKEDNVAEFVISSFLTSVLSILMMLAGLLTWGIAILPVIGLIVGLVLMFFM